MFSVENAISEIAFSADCVLVFVVISTDYQSDKILLGARLRNAGEAINTSGTMDSENSLASNKCKKNSWKRKTQYTRTGMQATSGVVTTHKISNLH